MSEPIILCGQYLSPGGQIETGCVYMHDGKIAEVRPGSPAVSGAHLLPDGAVILPGFIELQINGAFGVDLTETPSGVELLSRRLPERGVTTFLPTIVTSAIDWYPSMLANLDLTPAPGGAVPLGLHLEGPFLNPQKKGAHAPRFIVPPTPENLAHLLAEPGKVRILSLAPEVPGALEAVKTIREAGILPAAAHSMATYEQAREAFQAGISYGVHLFNAMPPLNHREPGLIGALLEQDAPPFGLIPDGVHIHPAVMKMIFRTKGPDGITLVSDAMAAAGLEQGVHRLGTLDVIVDGKSARLRDGTLAGSVILLDDAVRCMVELGVCDLPAAARMASETPARVLGLQHRKGLVAAGYDADLVILDEQLHVFATLIGGEFVYHR